MVQRRTRGFIGLLGFVLITVGVVDFGQAGKPRFTSSSKDPDWVLDSTTSLQWQRTPGGFVLWDAARTYCTNLGGGARLPEIKELISLVDYSVAYPGPALPTGHPFLSVQSAIYWSATTAAGFPSDAWYVDFSRGDNSRFAKTSSGNAWCVR